MTVNYLPENCKQSKSNNGLVGCNFVFMNGRRMTESSPIRQILDSSKLKELANNNSKFD